MLTHLLISPNNLTRFHRTTAMKNTAPFAQTSWLLPPSWPLLFALKPAYIRPTLRGSPPTNNLHRVPVYLIFSLIMLTILHGVRVLKVLAILSAHYALTKATGGTTLAVPVSWISIDYTYTAREAVVRWLRFWAFALGIRIPGKLYACSHLPY
jgi:hypothetical protein